jgi:inner membrane protein
LDDEDAVAPLQQLQSAYPNAAIYLSGSLTLDFPEEVKLPILCDQYQTVNLSGAAVNLGYCGIGGAMLSARYANPVLKDQYAVATVTG